MRRLTPIVCASALSACAPSFEAHQTLPDAELLAPCVDPDLVPNPDTATVEEVNVERVNVATAYVLCKDKQAGLVKFLQRMAK